MANDVVCYLNESSAEKHGVFTSRLVEQLRAAKITKMPAAQWIAFIKGLTSKGVKMAEIEDSKIIAWLSGALSNKPADEKSITKEELIIAVDRHKATIKEVLLGRPQYTIHSHGGAAFGYHELLFIANAEADNIADRVAEIEFDMESLSFDSARLFDNPGLATALESERSSLLKSAKNAVGFEANHFSNEIKGKHGRNMIAHARVTIHGDLFFIEEIQSDWGQTGQMDSQAKAHWLASNPGKELKDAPSWQPTVAKGPLVTDTKLWAGMVMRRLMQRAALNPAIKRVAWIRLCMRNGWKNNPADGDTTAITKAAMEGEEITALAAARKTDHFYMNIIPSLADSVISKSGVKTGLVSVTLDGKQYDNLPGFEVTDDVRELMLSRHSLYSAANVLKEARQLPPQELALLNARVLHYLGDKADLRLVTRLYDFQDMSQRSGSCMNRLITLALNAEDIHGALDHECYHFAHENLLSMEQRQSMLNAFAPHGELNNKVRDQLIRSNQLAAAKQCDNAEEAAAHGFALWVAGKLELRSDEAPTSIFGRIKASIVNVVQWLAGEASDRDLSTPAEVFSALRSGEFSRDVERPSAEDQRQRQTT